MSLIFFFFFQAEDGIRDPLVTGVQTCALPIFEAGATRDSTTSRTVERSQIAREPTKGTEERTTSTSALSFSFPFTRTARRGVRRNLLALMCPVATSPAAIPE